MSSGSGGDGTDGLASTGKTSNLATYIGIGLFVGIALLVAFCYVKSMLHNRNETLPSIVISPDDADNARRQQSHSSGLDLEHISLLPTFLYQPSKWRCHNKGHEHKDKVIMTVDCAVCLGELEEGEMVRVLPACKHYFHVNCIDMWLSTNSSCPMCRAHPEPNKGKLESVAISPPWNQLPVRSSSLRQFSFGSCLGSPFVKTPRKSPSSIGASPFHASSWQGSPSMLSTPPMDLHQILARARTPEH